jgi:hypothetical protein
MRAWLDAFVVRLDGVGERIVGTASSNMPCRGESRRWSRR